MREKIKRIKYYYKKWYKKEFTLKEKIRFLHNAIRLS